MKPESHGRTLNRRAALARTAAGLAMGLCLGLCPAGALAQTASPASPASSAQPIRGKPIRAPILAPATTNTVPSPAQRARILNRPDTMDGEFIRLGFDKLSAFKYDTYEVISESHGGRPLIKSDDVIPSQIKAYDGKRVTVTGFVMPLRLKGGKVIEFLLMRDQGTCCFGEAAQLNHFMRVRLQGEGFRPGSPVPYRVSGLLHVGEMYVAGYLTGIYSMDAEQAMAAE